MRLSRNDILFTSIMLVIIALLATATYFNYTARTGRSNDAKPIGVVEYKRHEVMRKYGDRFAWENIENMMPVYLFDSVLTRDQSDAKIILKNGMELELDANTMVELDLTGDKVGIKLKSGTIKAKRLADADVVIKTQDGRTLDLKDGEVRIDQNEDGVNIAVKDGDLEIENKDGSTQNLKDGSNLHIDKTGKLQRSQILVHKLNPGDGATLLTAAATRQVHFRWAKVPKANRYQLRVGRNSAFRMSTRSQTTRQTSSSLYLARGTWFWQVRTRVNGRTLQSAIHTLKIKEEKPLRMISPGHNTVITTPRKKKHKVVFRWKNNEQRVKIEVSKDPSLKKPIVSKVTGTNSLTVGDLDEHRYYWRVTPNDSDRKSRSKVYSFRLRKGDGDRIVVTQGEEEDDTSTTSTTTGDDTTQTDGTTAQTAVPSKVKLLYPRGRLKVRSGGSIVFRWSSVRNADGYQWQLLRRGRVIRSRSLRGGLVRITATGGMLGNAYRWRVRAQRRSAGRTITGSYSSGSFRLVAATRKPTKRKPLSPPRIKSVKVSKLGKPR